MHPSGHTQHIKGGAPISATAHISIIMESPGKKAKASADLSDGKHAWPRPAPSVHNNKHALAFQLMEATHANEKTHNKLVDPQQAYADKAPVVKLYGVTAEGNSVLAHVHGFRPYFYIDLNSDKPLSNLECDKFKRDLNLNVSDLQDQFMQSDHF